MSLRKSPTLTPALLASQRRDAQKSSGPRTARGKATSRLNRLRHGRRSPEYLAILERPAGGSARLVVATAWTLLASGTPCRTPCTWTPWKRVFGWKWTCASSVSGFRTEENKKKEFFFRRSKPE